MNKDIWCVIQVMLCMLLILKNISVDGTDCVLIVSHWFGSKLCGGSSVSDPDFVA